MEIKKPETDQQIDDSAACEGKKSIRMRVTLVLALVLCCAALISLGTQAYFNAEETAVNLISTGTLDMTLHDETTDGQPFPAEGIDGVMPGEVVDKVVYVANTGDCDFYTRISLEKIINHSARSVLNPSMMQLNLNTADWTEKDGWFYYKTALKPGEKTSPLFTTVSFSRDMSNEYMDCRAQIIVDAQAVQSRNNGTSALDCQGWAAN